MDEAVTFALQAPWWRGIDWFVFSDDDMYFNPRPLLYFLSLLDAREPQALSHAPTGTGVWHHSECDHMHTVTAGGGPPRAVIGHTPVR